ncbi:MAG: hypothetical protein CFH41_01374 [Alphaproteobacteria bacterium MarineAlpha11_Bin1]|nr:MAG: hypothetical protein CFH41_01374 [Alphaproteobacteria bacterium MarineAlpha11_Bin1]
MTVSYKKVNFVELSRHFLAASPPPIGNVYSGVFELHVSAITVLSINRLEIDNEGGGWAAVGQ